MTKQEIMNYVTETPHNVNRNILGQKLDEFQKNVSWNDLKDKPFYTTMEEMTITADVGGEWVVLPDFPPVEAGNTVTIKVDGVEHSLVAHIEQYIEDSVVLEEYVIIGDPTDDLENGTGQFGWQISDGWFYSTEPHTVSYMVETVHKLDAKYQPEGSIQVLPIDSYGNEQDVQNVKIKLWDPNETFMFAVYDGELTVENNGERRVPFITNIYNNLTPTHTSGTKTLIDKTMTLDWPTARCMSSLQDGLITISLGKCQGYLQAGYRTLDFSKFTGFGVVYNPDNEVFYRCILTCEGSINVGETCSVKCTATAME